MASLLTARPWARVCITHVPPIMANVSPLIFLNLLGGEDGGFQVGDPGQATRRRPHGPTSARRDLLGASCVLRHCALLAPRQANERALRGLVWVALERHAHF